MKSFRIPLIGLACYLGLCAESAAEDAIASTVARLKADIAYLADDDLEGRDVGSEGIEKAGDFIARRFQELGLETDSFEGTPYQDFSIPGPAELGDVSRNQLAFAGLNTEPNLILGETFNTLALGNSGTFDGGLVFAGYGITAPDLGYDDYAGVDVEGKVVIVIRKEPQQRNEDSIFEGRRSSQYAYFSSKELNAAVHNAAALIIVNDSQTASRGDQIMGVTAAGTAVSDQQIPTFYCQRSVIDPILQQAMGKSLIEIEQEIDSDVKPRSQVLEGISVSGEAMIQQAKIPVRNVIGLLPGAGDLADEFVVVGAHYDHVGMGGRGSLAPGTVAIHNGADDNASGTTTMMEVARRMAANQSEHRRSLVFMAFTGEERGLLGSKHYVRNPRWPLEKTVAMVNMDMVGRLTDNRLTVFGTGTAENFEEMVDRLNATLQFSLDKQAAGFGPSDHSSFYQVDIPVFHFFTGLHNDYHRPSDDVEKVNYDGMARIATMVTQVVSEITTAADKPVYVLTKDVADVGRGPRRGRRTRAVLGIQLALDHDGPGAAIEKIPADGPAKAAGLRAGDVIVKVEDTVIESIRDLRTSLASKKPGDEVQLVIKRGEEVINFAITLGKG